VLKCQELNTNQQCVTSQKGENLICTVAEAGIIGSTPVFGLSLWQRHSGGGGDGGVIIDWMVHPVIYHSTISHHT